MMYGLGGKEGYNLGAQQALEDTGKPFAGDFLSFGVSPLRIFCSAFDRQSKFEAHFFRFLSSLRVLSSPRQRVG